MLKLLLGGSGSGKTTLLYQRIRARAEAGEKSILLVPEQFTSSTEGRIHRELGDALSGLVESFSFTSLAEHILSAEGGSAVQTLSDAGRAVLVRRALEELQDNVHFYYRHRRSAAFCQMAAAAIVVTAATAAGRTAEVAVESRHVLGIARVTFAEIAVITVCHCVFLHPKCVLLLLRSFYRKSCPINISFSISCHLIFPGFPDMRQFP